VGDPFQQPPVGVPPSPEWSLGPPPANGLATAAMVVGIIAILPALTIVFAVLAVWPGVLAIVLGAVGLSRAKHHPARPGRGQAIAGIVLGGLTVVALIVEIVLFAIVIDSVDVKLVDQRPAEVDDYQISDRTCEVRDDQAVAGGVLTNRSGAAHAFILDVGFEDGDRDLGTRRDMIESALADGQQWAWEVVLPLDSATGVDTDGLDCRIVEVDIATVDNGD
jgi:hypothetical protein